MFECRKKFCVASDELEEHVRTEPNRLEAKIIVLVTAIVPFFVVIGLLELTIYEYAHFLN